MCSSDLLLVTLLGCNVRKHSVMLLLSLIHRMPRKETLMTNTIEYLGDTYTFAFATPQRNYQPAARWFKSFYGDLISIPEPWDFATGNVGS